MTEDTLVTELGIRTALVIDDDEVARNLVASYFRRMGVTSIVLCEDGESGWDALREQRFDCIVLDWKLPGLSGLAFFNRIRRQPEHRLTPVLVISGFLEKNDFRLLQEFPCTSLLEKPFTGVLWSNRIEELARERDWYIEHDELVDSLMDAAKKSGKKAEQELKRIIKTSPNPVPLALLVAKRLIELNELSSAQSILEGVLRIDERSVVAMNELGKVLHLLGRHEKALDALRLANKLSPQNVARLCLLGEVELNLKEPEHARAYFENALTLDPDDSQAKAGVVISENLQAHLPVPEPMQVPRSFASLMNTMGIAMVRSGQFAKGLEHYESALAFLHRDEDAARVAFNLGLGYLRWGKPDAALPWFQRSEGLAAGVCAKAADYVRALTTRAKDAPALDVSDQSAEMLLPDLVDATPSQGFAEEASDEVSGEGALDPGSSADEDGEPGGEIVPFPNVVRDDDVAGSQGDDATIGGADDAAAADVVEDDSEAARILL